MRSPVESVVIARSSAARHLELIGSPSPPSIGHGVRFYEEGHFPVDVVADFLVAGLRAEASTMAIVTRPHQLAIRERFFRDGLDVDALLASGQLALLDATEILARFRSRSCDRDSAEVFDEVFGSVVRCKLDERPRLYAFGELVDLLCREGSREAAIDLEARWNELRKERPFELLCAYSLDSFDEAASANAFGAVCDEHCHVHSTSVAIEVDGLDAHRLAAHYVQRTRALERELARGRTSEIERLRLVDAERAAYRYVARLQRVTSALSEAANVEDVLRVLSHDTSEALGARRAALFLCRSDGGTQLLGDAAFGAEEKHHAALVDAYEQGVGAWASPSSPLTVLPLVVCQRRLGAVLFELSHSRSPTDSDRALFEDLARQLAFALDRALLYEAAKAARDQAEEASRAKDEFLAMLGHELRNPLAPILTAVQLMRLRAGDVAIKERAVIERQVRHMIRLVDDLLDVSRFTRGTLELTREPVQLAEVLATALELASPLIAEKRHHLDVSVPDGVRLHADAARLAQVISNLLTNAARYTPQGGLIRIWTEIAGDRVALRVRDNGVGIDAALLPHIFDVFVQGRQSLARADGGLGLGLAIVRRLVELHGGSVAATSDGRGHGSTFTIELPIEATTEDSHAGRASSANGPDEPLHPGARLRVLVVDDNVDAAELLADAIDRDGHAVRVAHDGNAALVVATEFRPQVALLDLGLPEMDGYELAVHLRARLEPDRPMLVAVTGYSHLHDGTAEAGFVEHLVKPLDLSRLREVLASAAVRFRRS